MGNETMTLEKLGEGIEKINKQLDKQFEKIDQRFEGIDRRFESMDNRFTSIDTRIDKMENNFNKKIDALTSVTGYIQLDMQDVKSTLKRMDARYDETLGDLADFLNRLDDQDVEITFLKNDQNVIKSALRKRLDLDADSLEFR